MRLGIALGGGGARGFAHIGVLRALSEAGIEAEVVTGTSIGSLVGAVYAAGNLEELGRAACTIKLTDVPMLLSPSWSVQGMFSGKNALERIADFIGVETIEELPKTFAAVSSDIKNSCIEIRSNGPVREAIKASIAIPAVFTPVAKRDSVLVDGGLLEPVPVEAARKLGADFVIAVDLFGKRSSEEGEAVSEIQSTEDDPVPPPENESRSYLRYLMNIVGRSGSGELGETKKREIQSVLTVIERSLSVSQLHLTELRLTEHAPDFLIQPVTSNVGLLDFHRASPLIEEGYQAAKSLLPQLQEKLACPTT